MSLVERRDTNGVDTRLVDGLMLFMALVSAGMAGFQVYTYYTTWMWQSLVVAAGSFAALVLIGAAYWVKRRGRTTGHDERAAAGFLLIAAVLSAYGSGELAFTGSTLLFIVGGGLSLLLVAALFFQRWARVWVAAMAVYALVLAAINLLEPFTRFDVTSSSTLTVQVLLAVLVGTFFCVWFLVRAMLGAGTIRTRLLVSFVSLVLLPVVAVGIATVVGGLRSDRQQVINQLESVAILKDAEIKPWVDDLHSDLALALLGDEVMR
ncbi:MAG TPA: hypothetical protein VLC95_15860, partial [Anaerolineae bacterium]|nr:hypothetical protein [Anaerolineae bacterium]